MELTNSQVTALCGGVVQALAAQALLRAQEPPMPEALAESLRPLMEPLLRSVDSALIIRSAGQDMEGACAGMQFVLASARQPGREAVLLSVRVCAHPSPAGAVMPAVAQLLGRGIGLVGVRAYLMFVLLGPSESALDEPQRLLLEAAARPHLFTRHVGGGRAQDVGVACHLFEVDLSF